MADSSAIAKAAHLLVIYKSVNRRCRAMHLVRLVRNGGSSKQYGCVLCGQIGPTFAGAWKETQASIRWRLAHVARHVARYELEIIALDALKEGRTAEAKEILS